MDNMIKKWWQAPRRFSEFIVDREVSPLELFSDLVYVAYLSRIAHPLIENVSIQSIGTFILMFILGWWAWYNGTSYHDAHGNDDLRTRMFTFLQMFFIMLMAICSHHGLEENIGKFMGAFVGFQLTITYLWWRTGISDIEIRSLSRVHVLAYLISAVSFSLSIFLDDKIALWCLGIFAMTLLPSLVIRCLVKSKKVAFAFHENFQITHAIMERFSLFTIIVIGEIIMSIVNDLSDLHHFGAYEILITGFAILLSASIWSLYFDLVANRKPKEGIRYSALWMALHLPLQLSISVIGASILRLMHHGFVPSSLTSKALLVFPIFLILAVINAQYRLRREKNNTTIWFFIDTILLAMLLILQLPFVVYAVLLLFILWIPLLKNIES